MLNKNAFTLAEILITIVIIGIIAAATIPVMINKTNQIETMTALNKSYSLIQKALYAAQAKHGGISVWEIPETGNAARAEALANYILPHIHVMKVCGTGSGCFPNTTYKYLNGSEWSNIDQRTDLYKFVMNDGISVAIKMYDDASPNSQGFFVDVNGFKLPNTRGKDEFVFVLDTKTNMIQPYGKLLDDSEIKTNCSKTGDGSYCSTYVLRYNKLDYL
ncbi:MAG: prepilin-type N-terminal cleavage/methylation domain-containing protein [Candidatus Gastranaerophilales bacterium]|nr:prepilin-type N-terminal cleavage/methylation domain-containing protein [Candidatus Gastranaerophilales bacterium]